MPEATHVAEKLKLKYKQALYIAPTLLSQQEGLGADNEKDTEGKLIYFNKLVDYCKADPDYNITGTAGRECIMDGKNSSSSHHCNNLCCGHDVEEDTIEITVLCECKFVWCCKVECKTCYETKKKHRCKWEASDTY